MLQNLFLQGDNIMRIMQWFSSTIMFIFFSTMFIQFSNSILSIILIASLAIFCINFLVQKYINDY